jgi:nitrite reductase/ring-hydroxylating ferredoxin subunit
VGEAASATGPDFSEGISLTQVPDGTTVSGRVGEDAVLLSNIDGQLYAVGGTCTHYSGNLADGVIGRTSVRCPLHHACFDLRTGAALRAPALDPVDRWQVDVEGDRAFVRRKNEDQPEAQKVDSDFREVVIVGGGDPIIRLFSDEPALFVVDPRAPAIDGAGPLVKTATCGALELWTSAEATAVRDPANNRWAYVYITDDPAPTVYRTRVVATSCDATHVKIDLVPPEAGTPDVTIAVDLQSGDATNSARP